MRKLRPKNEVGSLWGLFFDNGFGSELKFVSLPFLKNKIMLEMVLMGDVTSVRGGGGVGFVRGDEIIGLLEVFLGTFGWIVEED